MPPRSKDWTYRLVPMSVRRHVLYRFQAPKSPFIEEMYLRRAIFVHVPKAAGTSLKIELYGRAAGGHRTIAEFDAFDPVRTEEFLKIAFVRNPWDRLLSAYSYLTRGEGANHGDRDFAKRVLSGTPTFDAFVHGLADPEFRARAVKYAHLRPQRHWICMPGERAHRMDFLGRYESMDADLATLRERLELPTPLADADATHTRTSSHAPYRDAYTDRTRDIVAEVYAEDIELLGYTF